MTSDPRPAPATSPPPTPGRFAPIAVEVAGWMVMFAVAALSFGIAGVNGFTQVLAPESVGIIVEAFLETTLDLRLAAAALLVVFVLAAAGVFLPHSLLDRLASPARNTLLGAAALATAVCAVLVFAFPVVWLLWVTALLLGLVVALLVPVPHLHRKPWRTAGVAAAVLLFITYSFQIVGGSAAGIAGVRWYLLLGAVVLFAAGVIVMLSPVRAAAQPDTGAFPLPAHGVRPPVEVTRPWACSLLFGVLGAMAALAQPAVAEHQFGQAGFAVIICTVLLGWAIGYELGPTFAPGMSRPRLTSCALLTAGVLTIALGVVAELSGKAVLSGGVAFAVGVGVRAQPYLVSRRIGIGVGVVLALLLTMLDVDTLVPLSEFASWQITATTVAYGAIGVIALVSGIVALFTFSPHGIQGIGVDLVHAFRTPPGGVGESDALRSASSDIGASHIGASGSGSLLGDPAREWLSSSGFFIAVEGGDGSGKTTQVQLLNEHLHARGIGPVVVTREPGGTPAGKEIRAVLLDGDGVAPRSEALLFAADRAQHIASLVQPALERDEIVITDRYIDSSVSYQAAGRELSVEEVAGISRWATEGLVPHLTIVLDIGPQMSAARIAARGGENHLDREDLAFRSRVQEAFLALAARDPSRYAVIDANRDEAAIAADIARAVDFRLGPEFDARRGTRLGSRPESELEQVEPPRTSAAAQAPAGSHAVSPGDVGSTGGPGAPSREQTRGDEAVTTVLPRDPAADEFSAEETAADEAVTTVLPPAGVSGAPPAGEEPTTVLPPAGVSGAPNRATTTEPADVVPQAAIPPQSNRAANRERLQAQAQIEREARERLRQARLRNSGQDGSGGRR